MITDRNAYERLCERERWDRLRAMTADESIALGEALLTSELMRIAAFPDRPRPVSLAVALGLPSVGHPSSA
ncbi:MAG: hypothetical protein ACREQL_14020 [Candidatus Binatia bacterium]